VLATVVTVGGSRAEAALRLRQALVDADLLLRRSGTSKAWLIALCARVEVIAGEGSLGLLDQLAASRVKLVQPRREAALLVAGIEAYQAEEDLERARFVAEARRGRPRVGPLSGRTMELRYLGQRYRLGVRRLGPRQYRVTPVGGARRTSSWSASAVSSSVSPRSAGDIASSPPPTACSCSSRSTTSPT